MEQTAQQRPYGFQPGVSGNPRGRVSRKHIEEKARELSAELGDYDRMSAIDRALLEQAATLLLRRPKNAEDVVRVSNSIARLLSVVRRRHPPRRSKRGSLDAHLTERGMRT